MRPVYLVLHPIMVVVMSVSSSSSSFSTPAANNELSPVTRVHSATSDGELLHQASSSLFRFNKQAFFTSTVANGTLVVTTPVVDSTTRVNRSTRLVQADAANSAGLRRRCPQVIIIGAKKAGTRALLEFLRVHPDVRAVGPEVHFFDKNYHRGVEWYR